MKQRHVQMVSKMGVRSIALSVERGHRDQDDNVTVLQDRHGNTMVLCAALSTSWLGPGLTVTLVVPGAG